MSQLDSTENRPGIYVPKPKPDVYTVLLVIALLAIIIAIVCLLLEMRAYHWDLRARGASVDWREHPAARTAVARADAQRGGWLNGVRENGVAGRYGIRRPGLLSDRDVPNSIS